MTLKKIFTYLLITIILIFAVQNMAAVQTQFFFWSFTLPRALFIVALLAVGFVIGWLYRGSPKEKMVKEL